MNKTEPRNKKYLSRQVINEMNITKKRVEDFWGTLTVSLIKSAVTVRMFSSEMNVIRCAKQVLSIQTRNKSTKRSTFYITLR